MSASIASQQVLHVGPDTQLGVLGMVPDDGAPAYLEVLILRRPVSSVDAQDFHPTAEPPRIPLHLAEVFADNVAKVAQRTIQAASVAPAGGRHEP